MSPPLPEIPQNIGQRRHFKSLPPPIVTSRATTTFSSCSSFSLPSLISTNDRSTLTNSQQSCKPILPVRTIKLPIPQAGIHHHDTRLYYPSPVFESQESRVITPTIANLVNSFDVSPFEFVKDSLDSINTHAPLIKHDSILGKRSMDDLDIHDEEDDMDERTDWKNIQRPLVTQKPRASLVEDQSSYRMILRQQPLCGLACGFSDTEDRRVLDPPPVLELKCSYKFDITHLVCYAALVSADGSSECRGVNVPKGIEGISESKRRRNKSELPIIEPARQRTPREGTKTKQNLVGSLVASPMVLRDTDGVYKIFFVLNDISIRANGQYCLLFRLISLNPQGGRVLSTLVTQPFEMLSPKSFPGLSGM
ncbi:hypothetical protein SmJEL517_g05364 [Synchytrium microbalum]|uniref:Velvet domain-containing protein n=1 Tax=Synchytrium microbalum TaxID=1806994 RepID=A0A507BPD6_9FUNG|nr:uncharacterized protein SmJEL517_g05364 [Synchytrium microbalum]TPX31237.1 hypothetical protein SmJEL517_g05364 [Synchytrium microbalum]